MKYPSAPLTPFLAPLPCIRPGTHILSERDPKDPDRLTPGTSITCRLLNPLGSLFASRFLYFQSFAASFSKTPGVWGTVLHRVTYAFSASLRYHFQLLSRSFFSRTYKLPLQTHRFASHAFSSTYKLLFSQLPCFQKHLRCPIVFSFTSQLTGCHPIRTPQPSLCVSVPSALSVLNSFLLLSLSI
jgi:hypothetical protein